MTVYLVNILYLVLFLVLYWKDRRRMANGFLFFILLVLSAASLLRLAQDTQSEFLYFVVFAVGILVALTLLAGVFILIAISLASALVLLRRERWVPANFLSLSVGLGLVLWMVLNALAIQAPDSVLPVAFYGMLCVDILLFYLLLTFSNFVLSAFLYQLYSPLRRQDYIIVLGCGLLHGSEVSPLLAGRIQRAWKVYRRQVKRGQKPPVLVMSGGQGADEALPEAQAMKAYAVRLGVPEQDVLTESASKNTWENMLFSTTNYHVFRAGLYAKQAGLPAQGIGAKTKFYYWYNAVLREYLAVFVMHKKANAVCIAILLLLASAGYFLLFYPGALAWLAGAWQAV
ncbi:MAG: YdcF family protein [Ruthenibacterium sp.]|nr:YdcF family protein [Ruthenibacterium sp.]